MSAISFLAGMGAGYIKAKDKALENERQAARDKRDEGLYEMKKTEFDKGQADQAELKAVGSEQQTPSYTPDQGQQLDAVANAKDAQGNPYYAVGSDASGKYTVTPNFQDESGAKPAPYSPATIAAKGVNYLGKNYNTPLSDEQVSGARRTRMADLAAQGNAFASTALRDIVQTDAAMGQLKEQKELQAHREYARAAAGSFQQGGWNGFGKFATEKYNDGKTYTATEDGKGGAIIVVTDKDGKETDRTAFASPEEAIVFAVSKSDPMKWVDYKTHAADKKAERADKDRDFGLKEGALEVSRQNADTNEQYRKDLIAERRAMTAARLATGGAGNGEGAAEAAAFNPLSGFDGKKAQAVAFEQAAAATNTDGKPLSPQAQGQLAQKIYRSMEDSFSSENTARERARVFKGAARTASTPDEINAVRERAKKSGYTDAEMALLDPRFKSVAAPKVPATKAQATNVVPAGATTQSVTAPPKYSYQAQMAEAEKTRLAKQAALREAEANEIAQEKLIEEKRKAFLASRGTDTGRANLSNTTVNLLR